VIREARVFAEADSMTRAIAEECLRIVGAAVAQNGRCAICLSGGSTPKALNALWARDYASSMPWKQIHLFWGDERYVPHDDPLSKFRLARETFISRVPIPPENVHPMPTVSAPPDKSAETYELELRNFFGTEPPEIDLQLQGIGQEGHTASLFPGSPALEEKQRWVLAVKVAATPPQRVTLSPVVLNRGRNTIFLVSGAKKREIIAALRSEPDSKTSRYPAARIQPPGGVLWMLDKAAAG